MYKKIQKVFSRKTILNEKEKVKTCCEAVARHHSQVTFLIDRHIESTDLNFNRLFKQPI